MKGLRGKVIHMKEIFQSCKNYRMFERLQELMKGPTQAAAVLFQFYMQCDQLSHGLSAVYNHENLYVIESI